MKRRAGRLAAATGVAVLAFAGCTHRAGTGSTEGRPAGSNSPRPGADWIQDEQVPAPFNLPGRSRYSDRMRNAVRAEAKKLQACYHTELDQDPDQYGELVIVFKVLGDGRLQDPLIEFSSFASQSMEPCVLQVFRDLQAPTPPKPGFTVRYPLVFTSDATPPEVLEALQKRYHLERERAPEPRTARQKPEDKAPW